MNDLDAGYLQALTDVHTEVRRMVQDPSTSSEGKLELLGVLSFLNEQIKSKAVSARNIQSEAAATERDK